MTQRGGFYDPDYARDKAISELRRRVSALEQAVAALSPRVAGPAEQPEERKDGASPISSPPSSTTPIAGAEGGGE